MTDSELLTTEGDIFLGSIDQIKSKFESMGMPKPIREFINLFIVEETGQPRNTKKMYKTVRGIGKIQQMFNDYCIERAKEYRDYLQNNNRDLAAEIRKEVKKRVKIDLEN